MHEAEGRGAVWTDERGAPATSEEGRRRLKSAPEESGEHSELSTIRSKPGGPADQRRPPEAGSATGSVLTREIMAPAAVVVLGAIMTIIDATIVNVALPTLGRDLHTSISVIQWVPTVYLLAFASVIPLSGRVAARRPVVVGRCPHRVPGGPGARRRDDHAARPGHPRAGRRSPADGPGD